MSDPTLTLLLYVILPLWLVAGAADWLCHRASHIERTTGAKETLIHLLMLAEIGMPLVAAIFLQVDAAIFALMIAAFLVHELTALWDDSYAVTARVVTPIEQHVHSFLEMIPLMALLSLAARHWPQLLALFGLGDEAAHWSLMRKQQALPSGYVATIFAAIVFFELMPYAEEFLRGLRANGGALGRRRGAARGGSGSIRTILTARACRHDAVTQATGAMKRGTVRIGISGWRYPPWRSVFYPAGLPQRDELGFAARHVDSVEINGSFYSLQRPSSWLHWHDETPDGFVFAVKGPRFITHMKKLADVRVPLANFLASGVLALRDKLGPMLWQLPPQLGFDAERLEAFFSLLPPDTDGALALAHEHDQRLSGRAWLEPVARRALRHAVEVRHATFVDPAFIALARRHGVAVVVADTAGLWPLLEDVTADFVYVRLHGDEALYASGYGDAALADWARRIAAWRAGSQVRDARVASSVAPRRAAHREVFCYFDNDVKVHAPFDAARLAARVAQLPQSRAPLHHQVET